MYRKKILFLTPLPPPIHGVSYINELIKKSKKFNDIFSIDYIKINPNNNIKKIGKFSFNKAFLSLNILLKIFFALIRKKFDLVYIAFSSYGPALYRDIFFCLLIIFFRKKIIFHLRGKEYEFYKNKILLRFLLKFIFENNFIIQHTELLKPCIENYFYDDSKWFFLKNGIPDNYMTEKKYYKVKKLKILFLSNLLKEKGVDTLFKGLLDLQKNDIDFICNIAGEPSVVFSEEYVFNFIKKNNLTENVFFHKGVYGENKKKLFKESDIFIFPTKYEAFGNVLIEAMSYGLLCIASNEGSIPMIIDNNVNGFLFEKDNSEELFEILNQVYMNPSMIEFMGKNAREKFKNEFTFDIFLRNLINIVKDILNQ